jgi:macrolide transport system ATP-binding/permease protein
LIRLEGVGKSYRTGDNQVHALRDIDLEIAAGEFVAIQGPSGSGKSTLLNVIGCLDRPTSGQYLLDGLDITGMSSNRLADIRNRVFGFVFQAFYLLPGNTALENASLPLLYAANGEDRAERGAAALKDVGLRDRSDHRPSELSGGEQQRVALARAMVNEPVVLLADEPTGNVDSVAGAEIMDYISRLHQAGRTVVIVTHDHNVAWYASRVVRLQDGYVVADELVENGPAHRPETVVPPAPPRRSRLSHPGHAFELALRGLSASPIRTLSNVVGILIGVAALVLLLAVSAGVTRAVNRQLVGLGSDILVVFPSSARAGAGQPGFGSGSSLTSQDAAAIDDRHNAPHISQATPSTGIVGPVTYTTRSWTTNLVGASANYADVRGYDIAGGRFFSSLDVKSGASVAVVGQTIVDQLFNGSDPVGRMIRINQHPFSVIGALKSKGSSGSVNQDDVVVVPITAAWSYVLQPTDSRVQQIYVQATSAAADDDAKGEITRLLLGRHKIQNPDQADFVVQSPTDTLQGVRRVADILRTLLIAIAAVALVVGGLGIANQMSASVRERTREIGIRMAVGARQSEIRTQFLLESALVAVAGGFFGIAIGVGLAAYLNRLVPEVPPPLVSVRSIIAALLLALCIGTLAGLLPARRAARLEPAEAIRYE